MSPPARSRPVALWLLGCCLMVAVMVWLGGVTRLTHSGLSMVEWEPVVGIVPPLSEADWQAAFDKYKRTPEYLHVNAGMDLEGFKGIFWLEYLHRVWGRLIGAVFLLPFLWFLLRGRISGILAPRLAGMFLLGGAQGGVGWLMVKSGLVDDPAVSHYRLTAHLALAVLIYGWMLWTALDLWGERHYRPPGHRLSVKLWLTVLAGLVFATLLFGGLTAGRRAGLIYNTWPLMDGAIIPGDLFPAGLRSLTEDIKTVQFAHRTLAEITVLVALIGWWRARRHWTPALHAVAAMAVMQVVLGIGTLVMVVPVPLASAHQMGALLLFTLCLLALHAECRGRGRG